jgi:hypothetical protein
MSGKRDRPIFIIALEPLPRVDGYRRRIVERKAVSLFSSDLHSELCATQFADAISLESSLRSASFSLPICSISQDDFITRSKLMGGVVSYLRT